MRVLYLDIDTLRADHLGCYGYHRATTPNLDALAAEGVRFASAYASDVPCLPMHDGRRRGGGLDGLRPLTGALRAPI